MNILANIFNKKTKTGLSRDEIISMLKTSPERLEQFEKYYQTQVLPNQNPDVNNMFDINAKQAAAMSKQENLLPSKDINEMIDNIVNELLAKTFIWEYNRFDEEKDNTVRFLETNNNSPVTLDEIKSLPKKNTSTAYRNAYEIRYSK